MSPRNKDPLGKEINTHSNLNWKNIILLLRKDFCVLWLKDSKTTSFVNFWAPFRLWLSITRRLYLLVDEVALREGKQVVGDISSLL